MSFVTQDNGTGLGSSLKAYTYDQGGGIPAPKLTITYSSLPEITNPYPANGTTNVSLTPTLNITVNDADGDSMTIDWHWGNSTVNCTHLFETNSSVSNGTYYQVLSNASANGQWWYWKVNVSDGFNSNESGVFSFYTGMQSKIVNVGTVSISGCAFVEVQFWNGSTWLSAVNTTVTSNITVNVSEQFGLDTIFNSQLVNTSDLVSEFGYGTYRMYAAFRDPKSNVLLDDDGEKLEATWQFTITSG
jgi:hypothetical protein